MLFCPRCGAQIGEDALFCPNCGAPLTKRPVIPFPKSESFSRYFSRPFINCIILSTIMIFSIFILGGSIGDQVNLKQAQQMLMEIEKEIGHPTALNIFINNVQIALISFIPIIGSIWMLFVQYNTGYGFGITAKAYEVNFVYLIVLSLVSPIGLLEYPSYILALGESFIIVYSILKRNFKRRLLKQTWKTLLIVIILLFIGGIVEALLIGTPII